MEAPAAPTAELDGLNVEQAGQWRQHIGRLVLWQGKPHLMIRLTYGEQGADYWSVTLEPVVTEE